ncbi:hypothetical protein Tco_0257424 [Tanacetum coccineum]
MAVLESCPKHNMVAYLEKSEGNAEFHEVIDFLTRSSIYHALTVSPVVSTTFVEQFWMSAKSKIINNVRYITAKVAGKPVSISEASIRNDLLFYDADRIDSLPNQAIFDDIQLMGYEGDLTIVNVPVPLDHFPVNALTGKVFSFMVKKGKHFSGKVTPLFASMLVQSTEDEGATSERPSEPQPTPSPSHPRVSGGNQGGQSSSDRSLSGTEGGMTLQSVYDLCISLCTQGRKSAKAEPSVHKDPLFDELDDDEIDNIDTEDAQDVGRSRDVVNEEKENADAEVSTEDVLSTAQQKVSTDNEKVSTDRPKVSTDGSKVSTDKEKDSTDRTDEGTDDQTEGRRATQTTQTTTSTMFGDDETIAQVLLNMSQAKAVSREKEKGVEFKDVEETKRPRPTSTRSLLTLKPLPKIDPKVKGKKKIEEEDESKTESEGIPEAEKKFKQLASDEEMARKLQKDWETEEERKRLAEEEATNDALIRNYDDIKARIEADRLLAKRIQEEEREQFTVEERKFEEIQALYEKIKRSDEDFIAIGSAEDERMIKEMNEKGIDYLKNESVKEESKEEEGTKKRKSGHIKMIARKKPRKQSDDDSDDKHRKCLKIVTFEGILDSEIMEKKSIITRLDKVSSPDGDYLVIYKANGNFRAFIYLIELEDGIVVHMLVERRYPFSKELLQRMLDLGLEVERESSVALDLIRFIKQQIDEE